MYPSLGYYDVNYGLVEDPNEKLPYMNRNKTHRLSAQEKWKEACLGINPDFEKLSEVAKEMIETKLKVEYYIALGLDTSLPRTATSGSIKTPRVSPLVQRPLRAPSRAPSVPLIPSPPLAPLGPLPPLPLSSLVLPSPISPIPSFQSLSVLAPITPIPPLVPANPYIPSFYQQEDRNAPSTSTSQLLEDPFSLEKPDPPNFYNPSTSSFSAAKLAQSSSTYVDCPSIYDTRGEFFNNNSEGNNNNNGNNNNDEPFDYTFEALNQWNF